jgi:DNA-binding CsgD family transcriptional regulator
MPEFFHDLEIKLAYHQGDWDRIRAFHDPGPSIHLPRLLSARALIAAESGDHGEMRKLLASFRESLDQDELVLAVPFLPLLSRIAGIDLDLEPFLHVAREVVQKDNRLRQRSQALLALALAGYLRDDLQEVERWLRDELAEGPTFITDYGYTMADHVRGLLFSALGRREQADRFFERAYRVGLEHHTGPCLAWTCYDYAAHLQAGSPDRAAALVSEGRRLAAEIGLVSLQKRLAPLARRLASAEADPLTRREKEVVSLVAQGKTNKEIATELFISYHTVVSHMRSIFEKTGVKNRFDLIRRTAQAARRP